MYRNAVPGTCTVNKLKFSDVHDLAKVDHHQRCLKEYITKFNLFTVHVPGTAFLDTVWMF